MLEDALFEPEPADAETQAINLNHSEAGCAFETQVDESGEEKDVAVCALTEKLPMTQEGRSMIVKMRAVLAHNLRLELAFE